MASLSVSVSLSPKDAELRSFIESVAVDPDNLVSNDIKGCLYDYMVLCQKLEHQNLQLLLDNIDHVKADKSARGNTWVLLAKDTEDVQP